jgi:hypothetical protein
MAHGSWVESIRHNPPANIGCIAFCAVLLLSSGCSALRSSGTPLADSLNELMPHGDRDHFVYIWQKVSHGERLAEGIQVEHVEASRESDVFEVILSEDGVPSARLRLRDDGQQIALLNEDDLEQQIRLSFKPGLTQFEIPIVASEREMRTTALVSSLTQDSQITSVDVSQVIRLRSARGIKSTVGDYPKGVGVETQRILHWPWGDAAYATSAMVVPGLGEIRSEASTEDGVVMRRELACAIIAGRSIGDCSSVDARIRELRDARSPNVR